MFWDLVIVSGLIVLMIYLFFSHKKYYNNRIRILEPLNAYFESFQEKYHNIFQKVLIFPSNDVFDYLVAILTVKKIFDPLHFIFPQNEKLILTGKMKKKIISFYIKKSKSLSHLGIKFLNKQKGDPKYKIYGSPIFTQFVKKYDIEIFYITYLPKIFVRDCSYKCILFLEMDPKNVDDSFFSDFMDILNYEDCEEKKFIDLKKKYENEVGTEMMKINIKAREKEIVENRQKTGEEIKKKKKENIKKFVVKNK